jgi:hypothetical protein
MYEFAVTPAVTQLRRPGVIITEVAPESLAEELELQPNDRIVRVNGRQVRDYLDFRFQTAGETEMTLLVKKPNGESWEIEIEREEGEDFGLMFEQIVPRQCANECLFCFCKGNPDDARPSLFVRDEDIRLSFLYGNYTTLSSITDDEMKRIVEQRLSPQYVSVHATDLKTRAYLLGVDEKRADIFGKLNVLHYCVANMPGAVPRTSTFALTNATLPYALDLANKGFEKAIKEDVGLEEGVNTYAGKLTYEAVAASQNLEYTPLNKLVEGIAAKAAN